MQTLVNNQWIICVLLAFGLCPSDGRVVRFAIDEELEQGSKIGSLLDHVPGSFNNLNFVQLSSSEDVSNWFTVDQYSGDVKIASRLDREQLCVLRPPQSDGGVKDAVSTTPVDDDTVKVFRSPCELRFSVNCLSAQAAPGSGSLIGGKVIELFDIVITLRDINDNGCTFIPHDRQVIHLREDSPVGKTRIPLHSAYDPDDVRSGHSLSITSIRLTNADNSFTQKHRSKQLSETEFHQIFRIHSHFTSSQKFAGEELDKPTESNRVYIDLELTHPLDYEKQRNFTFALSANDRSGRKEHQCTLEVLILVEDCNDNIPRFENTHHVANLSENTPIGTLIVQLNATDADTGVHGAVTYSLVGSSTVDPNSPFYVHPTKGELLLQQRLNHRQKSKHKLSIQATNVAHDTSTTSRISLQPSQVATVEINVIDVNDQAPKIRLYSPTGSVRLEVIEESPPGQDVAIVDVTDRDVDQNAEVDCNLMNQSFPDALKIHFLDGPTELSEEEYTKKRYKITVVKSLDRELTTEIRFTVRCWDHGTPRLTTDYSTALVVLDINDHAPSFDKDIYSVSVMEDSDPERSKSAFNLIQVHARDKDTGLNAQIRYRIDHGTASSLMSLVKVDPDTGMISSTGTLDREKMESFSLTILATDMGDPAKLTRCKVDVHILDYNDNAPVFSKSFYNFKIPENSPIGQLVGTLRVTDVDSDQNCRISVRLEDGSDTVELSSRSVWSTNGLGSGHARLPSDMDSTHGDIPRRSGKTERLTGIPQIRVVSYQPHHSNMGEDAKNGSLYEVQLYTNSIWDREALFAGRYRKPLLDSSAERRFDKSSSKMGSNFDDELFNQTQLDPYLIIHLRAEDHGSPSLIKRVPVRIQIQDENDNSPTFLFPNTNAVNISRVKVSRNEPQQFVFSQVYAFDEDSGPNGTVHYFIQSGDPNGYFLLDELTGAMTLGKRLPSYALGEYNLYLEARDGGYPFKSTMARLIIEVDESVPKGLLGPDLFASRVNSLFDSGVAGHKFNLYILIAIVVASAVVSALLLFSIFFLLRRSRRARSCRHVSGCANGTGLHKSNSIDPITDKYNSVNWPLTGGMTSPASRMDERRHLYADLNYRTYSPLLDVANSNDPSKPGTTSVEEVNGLSMDKRHATLMNPHLYSLGNLISCDSLKPSHLELCIPPSEQAATTVSGHFGPSEHIAFYRSLTGQEPLTPFRAEVFHQPAHNYALSGTECPIDSNYQSEQASLDGGVVCFASQKGISCQFPHQQLCYMTPVSSQWSQPVPTIPTKTVIPGGAINLESNSMRSLDCDSGNGDSLDIIPSTGMTLLTRMPNNLSEKQTYLNC